MSTQRRYSALANLTAKKHACEQLARRLVNGELAVFLGAGASTGAHLPNWFELTNRCCGKAGITANLPADAAIDDVLRLLDRVKREAKDIREYQQWVHDSLYRGIKYDDSLVGDRLLIALGALMMGSSRGSVDTVITYNFDDVLEWYLGVHGFTVRSVDELPMPRSAIDVCVYHPHGFLPKGRKADWSKEIVFDKQSYNRRLGKIESSIWTQQVRHTLREKCMIFVGLSGNDPTMSPIITTVNDELESTRELGVWLFAERQPADGEVDSLLDQGIAPLYFDSYQDIPAFLLTVCQKAAKIRRA